MSLFNKISNLYSRFLLRTNPEKWGRKNGVVMGKGCRFTGRMNFGTEPYLVTLGNRVSISGADFITHDGSVWVIKGMYPEDPRELVAYGRITVKDNVFIGSGCTILRGVTIGENTVVGACSLVNKSLEPNSVYAGVPARRICSIEEYAEKIWADIPDFDIENYKKNKKEEVLKMVDNFKKR